MSDPIWGPKGFWADYNAAKSGSTFIPSGNRFSSGYAQGRMAKGFYDMQQQREVTPPSHVVNFKSLHKQKIKQEKRKRMAINATLFIRKKIEKHIEKGTLEDYLRHDGAKYLTDFRDILYKELNTVKKAPSISTEEHEDDVKRCIERLKVHLNDGTFEKSLTRYEQESYRLRHKWRNFLWRIPNKTKAQIQATRQRRLSFIGNSLSLIYNATVFVGIGLLASSELKSKQHTIVPPPAFTHYVTTESDPLTLRQIPNGQTKVGTIPKGDCVETIGSLRSGWIKVAHPQASGQTQEGYVAYRFLKPVPAGYRCQL